MTAKEYLSQAKFLDIRINSKLEQIESLNQLATKASSILTGMPHSPRKSNSTVADAVTKIVDLQNEINHDMESLVELKQDITKAIKRISDVEYQTLLEKRYLCFLSWEQIAVDLNYSIQHTFRIHDKALKEIDVILKDESK